MPNLMDIFAGSDEVVRFEPVGPEDEAAAQQETDYVNHVFMQQNPGFMILYSFIKDALQDHTADSIKSLEGFRIAWIDEAQSLSARSLALLRPTIAAKPRVVGELESPAKIRRH